MLTLLVVAAAFVAFTNGANANFKGVASLYGSGTATLWHALLWGTGLTFAGSLTATLFASGLTAQFGGKGIVPDELCASPEFLTAVALGGALTSFLATRLGFPVSTTHALIGSLLGAGLAGSPADVKWSALGKSFVLPLVLSPAIAIVLGVVAYALLRSLRLAPDRRSPLLDTLHYLSTGAASFARGLNDTPKIAALLIAGIGVNGVTGFLSVGGLIAIGGLLDAKRVAETLGKKVTAMNPGQGFTASLVTAGLVMAASFYSLPVSTTHVSVGSLVGIGLITKQTYWRKVVEILLAWVTTVPCGAVIAALTYFALRRSFQA